MGNMASIVLTYRNYIEIKNFSRGHLPKFRSKNERNRSTNLNLFKRSVQLNLSKYV